MRPHMLALLGSAVLTIAALPLSPGTPSAARATTPGAAAAPGATTSLTVGGGASMFPAFDATVDRYAVRPAPDGAVRVDVGGSAPVWFDGVPDADGSATFEGVVPGQEISVFLGTGAERRTLALHVLPSGFPTLAAESTGAPLAPGDVALTLDRFDDASPRFEVVVDRNGVPVHTRSHRERGIDLKLAANGHFTVSRTTTTPGRTGGALVELDDRFQEVRRHETAGLVDTDDHDSLLLPDGSLWLVSYEPNATTGLVDSVIQHLDPDGSVVWQWSSAAFAGETMVPGNPDYAHINSIDVQPDGAVLASFRHLSSVFLIRPFSGGDEVVWKLGGRDSDFAFPDLPGGRPDGGPCAQHSARMLPDGHVLLFDNGSARAFGGPLCVDPADPAGPAVTREYTRVVELALAAGTATPVRTYGDTDRFAFFMGSVARTDTGNVLIGWSSSPGALATETDAAGSTVWRLTDLQEPVDGVVPQRYASYRAALVPRRDGFDPEVRLDGPADGAVVAQGTDVAASFSCTDLGGSTLRSCDGPEGRRLDTGVPGRHTWTVTARDGAGRTTTRTRSYTVLATPTPIPPTTPAPARPDLAIRVQGSPWSAAGRADVRTRPGRVVRAVLRVTNAGGSAGRLVLRGPGSLASGDLRISYVHRGTARTRAVSGRGWRTPVLDAGESLRLRVRVRVTPGADTGLRRVRLTARSASGGRDRARLGVRVR